MPSRNAAPFCTVAPLNVRFKTWRSARRRASVRVMNCLLTGFGRLAVLPAAVLNFFRGLLISMHLGRLPSLGFGAGLLVASSADGVSSGRGQGKFTPSPQVAIQNGNCHAAHTGLILP